MFFVFGGEAKGEGGGVRDGVFSVLGGSYFWCVGVDCDGVVDAGVGNASVKL